MKNPLWTPNSADMAKTNISAFMQMLEANYGVELPDYEALHDFSVNELEKFWDAFWKFGNIIAKTKGKRIIADADKMPGAKFFPQAKFNFAENLLQKHDPSPAIIFWAEDKIKRQLTWKELYDGVSRLSQALRHMGVKPGDRIAGFVPNMPETVMAMLATTAIGAVWTSCSPDFGTNGVLDRFGQTEPKVLFAADGYYYNGKSHDSLGRVAEIAANLVSIEKVIILPLLNKHPMQAEITNSVTLAHFIEGYDAGEIEYTHTDFNHPAYIMYSSGTTGVPKCIIHSAGGVLLTQKKEHMLHCDNGPHSRVFYFTTCGWMMWNWLVAALSCQSTVVLYEGSPFAPDANILFDLAEAEGITFFGTSAKYIDALHKAALKPINTHDLETIKTIGSTGSPLVAESFDYVYANIKKDVQLASLSGGTDLLGCFMGGIPIKPVYPGEIQGKILAMDVHVYDENGTSITEEKGELVCIKPFPSMPLGFWNDDGSRYHNAYFAKYDNIWHHGDFIEITETGGVVVYGRSDATLNPGGVRIGTAEIYRQVESFAQVREALVIGQDWQGDSRVILFVILAENATLGADLRKAIRRHIRQQCSPRHVPAKIIAVKDIPRTKSGKITELAVRDIVHGRPVKNKESLANPEALELYKDLSALKTD